MHGYDSFCCFRTKNEGKTIRLLWELNTTCNLNCAFCHTVYESKDNGRSFKDIQSDMVSLRQMGVTSIIFSGGEPLLRRDILDILSAAKQSGFKVDLCTNGTLIDQSIARKLSILLDEISISIDSHSAKLHDSLRGSHGSHQKAIRGLKLIQNEGLLVNVITLLNDMTVNELAETIYFLDSLGVNSVSLLGEMATMKSQSAPRLHNTDPPEKLLEIINNLRSNTNLMINTKRIHFPINSQKCSAGKEILGMDVSGRLLPCILFKKHYKYSLLTEWGKDFNILCQKACFSCPNLDICFGGCPGAAILQNGKIGIDPLCYWNKHKL
jgi:radical SAM protein with 4Fe4S-binding SPASM domain